MALRNIKLKNILENGRTKGEKNEDKKFQLFI